MKNQSNKIEKFYIGFPHDIFMSMGLSPCVVNFIFCQSCLETNYGTSNICRQNHNLFGMKLPKRRITTSVGENLGHAKYIDYMFSAFDYSLYLSYMRLPRYCYDDVDKYANWLRQVNYCPSPNYVDSIFAIYNQYFTN